MGRGRVEGAARAPEAGLTVPFQELILEDAARRGRKPALVEAATGRTILFEELPPLVETLARRLARFGVKPGTVVGLLGRNSPEYPVLVCGILAAGGAVAPVNPFFHPHEAAAQLGASGASLLVADEELAEAARAGAAAAGLSRFVAADESLALREIPCAPTAAARSDGGGASGDALLAWSVGPGGFPAPARHSHESLSAALLGLAAVAPWAEDDVVFSAISPYDLYGLVATLALSLRKGMTAVTAARFDVPSFAEAVRRWGVTVSNVVPTIVRALAGSPPGGLAPLRLLISGGAPLAPHVARACAARLEVGIIQGYGLAEGAGATHVDAPVGEARVESCGRPVAGIASRIAGPDGGSVSPGGVGELWLCGDQVFRGYRGEAEKTAAALTKERWLRTGDVGFEDASGRFTAVGRRKPVVKVKGFQVSPAEVEAALCTHPDVHEAAVGPEWDAETGEESAVARVVASSGASPSGLAAFLAARLARHKRPSSIALVSELPPRGDVFYPWAVRATS